jgi:chromosome segregation ATPase
MTTPAPPQPAIETLIAEMRERSERMRALSASPPDDDTRARAETEAAALEQWAAKFEALLPALAQERESCHARLLAVKAQLDDAQAALRAETQARQEVERQIADLHNAADKHLRLLTDERDARQQAERIVNEQDDQLSAERDRAEQAETALAQSIAQRELQESVIRHETQRREQAERERDEARKPDDWFNRTCEALGLFDGARPVPMAKVLWDEVLPTIEALKSNNPEAGALVREHERVYGLWRDALTRSSTLHTQLTASERARDLAVQDKATWRNTAAEVQARLAASERARAQAETEREALRTALEVAGEAIHSEFCTSKHHVTCANVTAALSAAQAREPQPRPATDPDWPERVG